MKVLLGHRWVSCSPPLSGLFVHDQGDVALDQGEGEEADVAGVFTRCPGLLGPEEEKDRAQCDWKSHVGLTSLTEGLCWYVDQCDFRRDTLLRQREARS